MNSVRIEPEEEEPEQVIELSLPEQDNEDYDELYQSVCNNNSTPNDDPLQYRHTDKVPTFALAKIGNKDGTPHEVCIDTGSAISLIDSSYLRRHFPSIKVQSASTIMLKGVGNNQTHGWIHADIHFINQNKGLTSVQGPFHVVTSLATKIIIGNDILAEEGVVINMKEGTCSFYSGKDIVSITSVGPKPTTFIQPSARLQKVFTIKPGFQARVPVSLSHEPITSCYMLDPLHVNEDIQVSRSVSTTRGTNHYAHVMNVGKNIIKLPAGIS
ncbi:hypothetical protein QFC21_000002 [Naganishia friedmannii]|uniref:Uncharacterized protein n=1 Tax=Naganishia friedmannii TaxID=89922 RepID=A0ACC2WAL6_9TREE|nr:hypothetical protein QFC21_000002 [Naganishia friedmannii]